MLPAKFSGSGELPRPETVTLVSKPPSTLIVSRQQGALQDQLSGDLCDVASLLDMLDVRCGRSDWHRRLCLDHLTVKHGANAPMVVVLRALVADCPHRDGRKASVRSLRAGIGATVRGARQVAIRAAGAIPLRAHCVFEGVVKQGRTWERLRRVRNEVSVRCQLILARRQTSRKPPIAVEEVGGRNAGFRGAGATRLNGGYGCGAGVEALLGQSPSSTSCLRGRLAFTAAVLSSVER